MRAGPIMALAAGVLCLSPVRGSVPAQDRPPSPVEVHCRREVDRLYAPGTLSRSRNERQRLIDTCVANGGTVPQPPRG